MSDAEPAGDRSTSGLRIVILGGLPVVAAVLIGLLVGDLRSGLVVGAGLGLGTALAAVTYRRLIG